MNIQDPVLGNGYIYGNTVMFSSGMVYGLTRDTIIDKWLDLLGPFGIGLGVTPYMDDLGHWVRGAYQVTTQVSMATYNGIVQSGPCQASRKGTSDE
jgi:hypothetical protein